MTELRQLKLFFTEVIVNQETWQEHEMAGGPKSANLMRRRYTKILRHQINAAT